MVKFAILILCAQALLIQSVLSQCVRRPVVGCARDVSGYGGEGTGQLSAQGQLCVEGVTELCGNLPVYGVTQFTGDLPAYGRISVVGTTPSLCSCACPCSGNGY